MRRRCACWLALAAASLSLAAPAATRAAGDPLTDACINRAGGVAVALHNCYAAAYQRADARLNAAYRRATAGLEPPVRAKLVAAQRAWLQFRDLDCAVVGLREAGGTDAPILVDQCAIQRTDARTAELDTFARAN